MDYLIVFGLWISLMIFVNRKEIREGNIDVVKAFFIFIIYAVPLELVYAFGKWAING